MQTYQFDLSPLSFTVYIVSNSYIPTLQCFRALLRTLQLKLAFPSFECCPPCSNDFMVVSLNEAHTSRLHCNACCVCLSVWLQTLTENFNQIQKYMCISKFIYTCHFGHCSVILISTTPKH